MSRRWKVAITLVVAIAVLLAINTVVTNSQTKPPGVTIDGGRILRLTGGDVQVYEEGPARAQPIVLIHCYACSLHWWDRLAPILARDHRVIRIDLLGSGGSAKPSTGYSIANEAALVAEALNRLNAQGAVVVGHSLGFAVTTALAEGHSELVDRAVDIGDAPNSDYGGLPLTARVERTPVIGQAIWRIAPDFAIKDGYGSAFAPDYDLADGFDDPNQVVEDYRAMTYTAYDHLHDAWKDYTDEMPLDARIRGAAVPLLVIFGTEDQIWDDPETAAQAYRTVPGAQIAMIEGAGHSPNVEKPVETARLIERFAAGAHYRPPPVRPRSAPKKQQQAGNDRNRQHGHDADGKRKRGNKGGHG